jgi:hypothetical protein
MRFFIAWHILLSTTEVTKYLMAWEDSCLWTRGWFGCRRILRGCVLPQKSWRNPWTDLIGSPVPCRISKCCRYKTQNSMQYWLPVQDQQAVGWTVSKLRQHNNSPVIMPPILLICFPIFAISQWPRGLKRGSAAAALLRLRVRIRERHVCLLWVLCVVR